MSAADPGLPRVRVVVFALVLAVSGALGRHPAAAQTTPSPAPSAQPAAGDSPCAGPAALLATVDRPGTGRATSVAGSPCVVAPGSVMLELGYRNQVTSNAGGTSTLTIYPLALIRVGLDRRNEIVFLAPAFDRRTVSNLPGFTSARGYEDAGIGLKHALSANARVQTAAGFFTTAPTGTPAGANGFGSGGPGYSMSYTLSYAASSVVGLNLTETAGSFAGADANGTIRRYFASSPSLTLSFALGARTALLVQDASTSNTAPGGPSANRALVALQRLLSPSVLIDAEYEQNLTAPPATRQHALGIGFAIKP